MRSFFPVAVLLIFATIFAGQLFAQSAEKGIISGKVIEQESGFEVIGGNVLIVGTSQGTVTDLDGKYQLKVKPGSYTLEFSYIGFASQTITDVVVKANELTALDLQLGEEAIHLDLGVTVTAKAYRNTEAAVLMLQKKSPVVMDGISAAQISKSGDSDVASAVRRVTGVTVEGGKYVYVRGLGDRYSKTTLNGAEIPGLDPNRNTVQMDIFPTNLVDNIIVYKTFSPNLPADFTGGYVDIVTKDFPEQFMFNVSSSLGYNSQANYNSSFLTYPGGKRDWIGFDDGTRGVPTLVAQNGDNIPQYAEGINNMEKAHQLANMTRAFENNWRMQNQSQFLNHSLSLSLGNQKEVFGKPLGWIAALSYDHSFDSYTDGQYGIHELTGHYDQSSKLVAQLSLDDRKSTDEVLWGAMLSGSYKLSESHKIGLTVMHNQSASSTARYLEGRKSRDDVEDIFQTRTWKFLQRGLSTLQLSGKHVFTDASQLELNWKSSYSHSSQDEPDLRYFTNRYIPEDDRYRIKPSSDNVPTRFYRNMEQYNLDNKLDLSLPFNQWNGLRSKASIGGSYVFRDRTFNETRYNFNNQSLSFSGNTFEYFEDQNLINVDDVTNSYTKRGKGVYVVNNYDARNNYDADQSVMAAYAMVELPLTKKLRLITGARMEQTVVRFLTYDEQVTLLKYPTLNGKSKVLGNTDILPSLNLNYEFSEDMKLRFAYSKTLARPSFRELAPFASFDVDGGFVVVGNPNLKRTLVDNLDLRWELYPSPGELISVSAFYKNFKDPIERTFNPEAPNAELTFENVAGAHLFGTELEVRKSLEFISPAISGFTLGANFSYVYSRTNISDNELLLIRASHPDANSYREMFGQAPYMLNALLSYKNEAGTAANLSFNVVGPRITVVTKGATPNYYEQPRPMLNFNISHPFASRWTVKLAAGNLLNADKKKVVTFKGTEYPIELYSPGRSFSLGFHYKFL